MSPEKEEEKGKAKEEEKSKSVPTSDFKDLSGAKFDENVDDSDAAMAKLNAELKAGRGHEEVAKKEDDTGKKEEKEANKSDEKKEEALDPASEAILDEIVAQKEAESKKPEGQTSEQKILELERKNKELYGENQSLKVKPKAEEKKDTEPVQYENMTTEQKEVYADWVHNEFGMTVPEFQKQLKFTHAFRAEYIDPRLASIDKKFSDGDLQKQLGNNKLYTALKDEVDEIVKNDTRLISAMERGMPKDVAISLAMDVVQKNNMPKIAKAIAEKESARAKLNKRVIVNDTSTVTPKVKDKKLGVELDNLARDNMAVIGVDDSDLEKYGGKPLVVK